MSTSNNVAAAERSTAYAKLREGFSAKVVSTLSVLTAKNTSLFVTGSDVAHEIIQRSGLSILESEKLDLVLNTCSILYSKFKSKKKTDIHRSRTKIHPLNGGNLAYGYRIGVPISVPLRDTTAIERERHGSEIAVHTIENIDSMFADIIKNKPINILQDYILLIMSEIEHRHNDMLIKLQAATTKNNELELNQIEIKERIVTVAKSIEGLK
jgi:hypothetical protein